MAGSNEMPVGVYSISKSEGRVLFLRSSGKTVALLPVGSTAARFGKSNASADVSCSKKWSSMAAKAS